MHSDATGPRQALDDGQFFGVFQPIVELRTGRLTGFELLARRRSESPAQRLPEAFIPEIERSGLSHRLTIILLKQAFSSEPLRQSLLDLSVNLSPLQLHDPDLPNLIGDCARQAGFPLHRVNLEITESALLEDLDRARAVVRELKALGCRLALDDFGTGYSSLRHLEALPFDKLKVDRSFVRSMTEARESRKIVAAVLGLGQSLGLTTVAEGVESASQASMLLWLGCDLGQGWLYGHPQSSDRIPEMLTLSARSFAVPSAPPLQSNAMVGLESLPAQRLAQIEAIYDGAPVGLCFLDRKMRYVSVNRRLADMNGAPVMAHLGKTVAEVIPHLFPKIEPFIRRALSGEPVLGVEAQKPAMTQSEESQTVLLSYQPARDEAGEILGVSVAVMDITGHKRTEEALRESISHFRHLLELGPHVLWVLNEDGKVVEASSRWEEITGQKIESALGDGWTEMLHPDDIASTREAIRRCLTAGKPIDTHYRVRTTHRGWLLIRARGSPRFGPTGAIIGIYGIAEVEDGRRGDPGGISEGDSRSQEADGQRLKA